MTTTNSEEERPRSAWVVRAGKRGEDEDTALKQNLSIVGFQNVDDLSGRTTREEIAELVLAAEPKASVHRRGSFTGQLLAFAAETTVGDTAITVGDTVVLPLKTRPGQLAIGEVLGAYEHHKVDDVMRHVRRVEWRRDDVPRTDLALDLRRQLNRPPTVYRIGTANATQRLAAVCAGHSEGAEHASAALNTETGDRAPDISVLDVAPIAEIARDEIHDLIRERFKGHEFARLVDAIIRAQGYTTQLSPPGPDGGIDILAGRGALGFGSPRLCVQVKATSSAADVKVVRELQGAMQKFGADQCLFVSVGGFTGPARSEAKQCYFNTRLWDANDVLQAIYASYDNLAEEIQAEIPLKQVWTLVRDDEA